jgi:hypothetical protein
MLICYLLILFRCEHSELSESESSSMEHGVTGVQNINA